jgi:hypothetical protein
MPQKKLDKKLLQAVVDAYHKAGTKADAARLLGINARTYDGRYNVAMQEGIKPTVKPLEKKEEGDVFLELSEARAKIRALETAADAQAKEQLTADYIKK